MSDKTREKIVLGIIALVVPAVVWSVWASAFSSSQWFFSHWHLLCTVLGAAGVLVVTGVVLMFRAVASPTVKTLAASAVVAAALVVPAQAQCGSQCEDYSAYNMIARFWNWLGLTWGDVAQGLGTSNQTTPQALSNNAAYGLQGQTPNGPPQGGPSSNDTLHNTREQ